MEAPWTPAPLAPGSIPAARAARAAARAKASNGWGDNLPSSGGGGGAHCCRWPGSFLPYAHAFILLWSVVARREVVKKDHKREGSQSPVGRGSCEEALLQAGLEPAIYATTVNDVNHYTTLPPLHVAQLHGVPTRPVPRSVTAALWTSPECVPSVFQPCIKGAFGTFGASQPPLGFEPASVGWKSRGLPLCHEDVGLAAQHILSIHQQGSASCVALAPLGAHESGQEGLVLVNRGFAPGLG